MPELKYKRILLKVSGEALAGDAHRGLDFTIVNELCKSIKTCVDMGVQIGLVIGAGNFWRGVKDGADKMQRSHADSMGMLGTVMNAIAVADALNRHGMDARVLSAVEMNKFAEYFTRDLAERYLNEGKVVLFAAGTGNPYFSTDTGAVGFHGFVTQLYDPADYDVVLVCGPTVMMKNAARLCAEKGTPCFVSMEKKMACGIGACLGCTCETKGGEGKSVCKNGPVFDATEVFF